MQLGNLTPFNKISLEINEKGIQGLHIDAVIRSLKLKKGQILIHYWDYLLDL